MNYTKHYKLLTSCYLDLTMPYPTMVWNFSKRKDKLFLLLYTQHMEITKIHDNQFIESIVQDLYAWRKSC